VGSYVLVPFGKQSSPALSSLHQDRRRFPDQELFGLLLDEPLFDAG